MRESASRSPSKAPRKRMGFALVALAAVLAAALAPHWHGGEDPLRLAGPTMGTRWSVQIAKPPAGLDAAALGRGIQARLDRLDRDIFSTYAPASELSRFNHSPLHAAFAASPELVEVVVLAREIHRDSGGAFDMTVGPLVDLWGFGAAAAPGTLPPAPETIAAALARVDGAAVQVDPRKGVLRRTRDVRMDLSGIAKGYAADCVGDWLERQGIADYLVEIGGELKLRGARAGGEPWRVAIEAPEPGARRAYETLRIGGLPALGLAGSGDYRNFIELGGRRYSHTLDPRSGQPVSHGLTGVTVVHPSAARADALATALMVLGPEAGFALASGRGLAAYFIMRGEEGLERRYTEAFKKYLTPP